MKIFIPVPVEEWKPIDNQDRDYFVIANIPTGSHEFQMTYYPEDKLWRPDRYWDYKWNVTHVLVEKEMICFTPEELKGLLLEFSDLFDNGPTKSIDQLLASKGIII